jgi:uncharacterized protein YukE
MATIDIRDIESLERFAGQLQAFNQDLTQIMSKIEGQLQNLGDSWRDEQYARFVETWRAASNPMRKYLGDSPGYVRYLKTKAAKLRDAQRY